LGEEADDTRGEVAQGKDVGDLSLRPFDREFFFEGEHKFHGRHRIQISHAEVRDHAVIGVEAREVDFELRAEAFA
jgi:hypothetical protein